MHPTARPCSSYNVGGHWQCTSQCTDLLENARPCGQAHDRAPPNPYGDNLLSYGRIKCPAPTVAYGGTVSYGGAQISSPLSH
ncbi:hypothetical protein Hanom_Chr13g01234491 [Helianthus anomalus]